MRKWRMSDRVGQHLGNYQLLHLIGRGNFTDVYLGEHLHLNTQAAIKVLHTRLTSEESEKLRTEARTMARLAHPHIVRVLDFGIEESIPFLIMEYAPNGTLRQSHPKESRVPLDIVVSYVKQMAEALQYIHTQKLIHRDVKPESMLLGRNNEVLLAEFGIAIIAQSTRSQQTQQTQEAAGSVAYMAPEQLMGKPRPASDQYALAVVTYEWLSGAPPFTGSVQQIASQHLSAHPLPLRAKMPAISTAVEQVVMKALDKDPQQRFANVADFALALEEAFDADSTVRTLFVPASGRVGGREQSTSALRNPPTGTVTLLFTEIEGSPHLLQQLGDRYGSLLAEYRHLLQASFQEWNGYEVESRGDAISAAFARATDAVVAAVEVQRALAAHPWPEGVAVHARMGLHTGEPTLTSEGYVGLDVHRAARIMSAGHGGQVLLSQTTAHLVEQDLPDDVNLCDLGEYRLKDLGRPKRLFQLDIAGLPVDFPPPQTLDSYPHNLPLQLTPFIGREQEVAAVCDLLRLQDVHLLALTGPGGTGKTRLALQAAAELSDFFADGVFFVNLAPISDPALVVPTIAETLGIRERADQSLLERLKEHLHQKQMLLLLDNFEQVVSAAAQIVDLLVACQQLKIMVTSREVPHVRARHEFAVPPLPLPDLKHLPDLASLSHFATVGLFISRAQAVKPDFQMTATNAHAIAEICARLDGLPLAIELAAARIKLLPPQALLARMGQRLAVLTSTSTDVPARQQTLLNTITWSYELLTAEEQRLFRRLSVFVGGCTLEAIEAVCAAFGDEAEPMLDAVASLIDKSLLQQTGQEDEEPRLVMLETIREYGLEALETSREMESILRAQAVYYLRLAEEAEPKIRSDQQATWRKRLEADQDNLRAVLRWTLENQETEMGLRLAGALLAFWRVSNQDREGRSWCEQVLAQSGTQVRTAARAKVLLAAGTTTMHQDLSKAQRLLEESISIGREVGAVFRRNLAFALAMLAHVSLLQGDPSTARELAEESARLFQEVGEAWGSAMALNFLGRATLELGDPIAARPLLEESAALFRMIGDRQRLAMPLIALGLVALRLSDYAGARTHFEEALTVARETGDELYIAAALARLGTVAMRVGDYQQSATLYGQSLALIWAQGYSESIALGLAGLAELANLLGQPERAACLFGAIEGLHEVSGIRLSPLRRAEHDRAVEGIHAQLDEATFVAAWAEGRTMSLEQILVNLEAMPLHRPVLTAPPSTVTAFAPPLHTKLTPREMDVLRLLAKGLTSAQIAEQLVIGLVTVNSHVRSIYSKLGVTSRAVATRYAIEHQLL
jgi:predicted ATPase/serine/threonine protein kinase/DNA-binding CsgD family transcriptional regulator